MVDGLEKECKRGIYAKMLQLELEDEQAKVNVVIMLIETYKISSIPKNLE